MVPPEEQLTPDNWGRHRAPDGEAQTAYIPRVADASADGVPGGPLPSVEFSQPSAAPRQNGVGQPTHPSVGPAPTAPPRPPAPSNAQTERSPGNAQAERPGPSAAGPHGASSGSSGPPFAPPRTVGSLTGAPAPASAADTAILRPDETMERRIAAARNAGTGSGGFPATPAHPGRSGERGMPAGDFSLNPSSTPRPVDTATPPATGAPRQLPPRPPSPPFAAGTGRDRPTDATEIGAQAAASGNRDDRQVRSGGHPGSDQAAPGVATNRSWPTQPSVNGAGGGQIGSSGREAGAAAPAGAAAAGGRTAAGVGAVAGGLAGGAAADALAADAVSAAAAAARRRAIDHGQPTAAEFDYFAKGQPGQADLNGAPTTGVSANVQRTSAPGDPIVASVATNGNAPTVTQPASQLTSTAQPGRTAQPSRTEHSKPAERPSPTAAGDPTGRAYPAGPGQPRTLADLTAPAHPTALSDLTGHAPTVNRTDLPGQAPTTNRGNAVPASNGSVPATSPAQGNGVQPDSRAPSGLDPRQGAGVTPGGPPARDTASAPLGGFVQANGLAAVNQPQINRPQPGNPQPGNPQPGNPQPGNPQPGNPQPSRPPQSGGQAARTTEHLNPAATAIINTAEAPTGLLPAVRDVDAGPPSDGRQPSDGGRRSGPTGQTSDGRPSPVEQPRLTGQPGELRRRPSPSPHPTVAQALSAGPLPSSAQIASAAQIAGEPQIANAPQSVNAARMPNPMHPSNATQLLGAGQLASAAQPLSADSTGLLSPVPGQAASAALAAADPAAALGAALVGSVRPPDPGLLPASAEEGEPVKAARGEKIVKLRPEQTDSGYESVYSKLTRPTLGSRIRTGFRVSGELMITFGLIVLLFAGYEVFGNSAKVQAEQNSLTNELDHEWNGPSTPATKGPAAPGTNLVGRLYIPKLDKEWVVVNGVRPEDIKYAPGHYPDTAAPGQIGNFSVAGHRIRKIFWRIDELTSGDVIGVETKDYWFVYRVYGHEIVKPTKVEVVSPVPDQPDATPTKALLTLTTCNPKFNNYERLIVHAQLVSKVKRDPSRPDAGEPAEMKTKA